MRNVPTRVALAGRRTSLREGVGWTDGARRVHVQLRGISSYKQREYYIEEDEDE